ncbi:MAG: hypothetical protein L3J09_11950 [Flavobacteriaceae bacterium]|nr:hypothetical protein [Flavobacteriaceae bacterium]
MKTLKLFFIIIITYSLISCNNKETTHNFTTKFEKTNGSETTTYKETILFYQQLAATYHSVTMYQIGKTDSGKPLHLVTFNPNRTFETEFSDERKQNILLINNGIHPGESDGIDATMMLMRDLAQNKIPTPQNTIIAVIPIYNLAIPRKTHSINR